MSELLNLLIVEDSEDDALLVLRELRRSNFELVWERVETAESLRTMLATRPWDIIVSDYQLPNFDAPTALEIVKQSQLDIPFIVISGAIGKYSAVEMMKAGAHDYVMKDNLTRLSEAVRRELREAKVRSERRRAEVTMKRQLAAMEAAIDGIAILQGDTFLYVNQAHLQLFGYQSSEELLGKSWRVLYSPEEVERFEREVLPILERDRSWQGEAIASRREGSTFAEGLSLTLTEDGLSIRVCRDISDLKEARERIIHDALHDPLTGLPNRTLLMQRLELAISRAMRVGNYHYAVLFIDLDRFKVINDSLGHWVGDRLLIAIGERLTLLLRDSDLVARLGGDEFVIVLEDIDSSDKVVQVTERILANFQIPFHIDGQEIFASLSIGIVWGNRDYIHAGDLIRDADISMYRAKAQGNNTYRFFDPTMHTQALQRHTLETQLRKAIEREEFVIYYQPIFNLVDKKLVGFEALIRWRHPNRGSIAPDEFIPVAEETNLIVPLDRWIFARACWQMATWKSKFAACSNLKIGINLSVKDLRQSNLLEEIDFILAATGLDGEAIALEITESLLIEDFERTIALLDRFKSRKIQVGLDDFGTGYSCLGYLHRFPVDNLKIDRSFVHQIQSNSSKYHVVDTIIALGKKLGLSVTAEGIETSEQLERLQQLGCEFGQGYLFSKPLAAADIERIYLTQRDRAFASPIQPLARS